MRINSLIVCLLFTLTSFAQNQAIVKGKIVNKFSGKPLPYTNITIQGTAHGSVSNEDGMFSLNTQGFKGNDTLVVSFIGFKTQKFALSQIKAFHTISLEEDLINLSEAFVFGKPPKPKDIIKKMIKNKAKNYSPIFKKSKVFVRKRGTEDILHLNIDTKKSTIKGLDKKMMKEIVAKIPRHNLSYSDFLGEVYFSDKKESRLKLQPIQLIKLQEKNHEKLNNIDKNIEEVFKKTAKNEFWKVKSGIFGSKIDIKDNSKDTTKTAADTIDLTNKASTHRIAHYIKRKYQWFTNLDDIKEWDFLYDLSDYEYTFNSGTRINGEDVFIIDFTPKRSGKFKGKLYITMKSYALIRADFAYAPGKHGFNIQLFGVGYRKTGFKGSILFEKIGETYQVKYFSYSESERTSFKRPIALLKKRKRFLFNKTLNKLKIDVDMAVQSGEAVEMFFLENKPITEKEWNSFKQSKHTDIKYVKQFSDANWKGYSIIEPTKKMRDYKKRSE